MRWYQCFKHFGKFAGLISATSINKLNEKAKYWTDKGYQAYQKPFKSYDYNTQQGRMSNHDTDRNIKQTGTTINENQRQNDKESSEETVKPQQESPEMAVPGTEM